VSWTLAAAALPVLALVLAGYVAALGYAVTRPSVPSATQDLADRLLAHHATDGLTAPGAGLTAPGAGLTVARLVFVARRTI
jgi:hypothetical protein